MAGVYDEAAKTLSEGALTGEYAEGAVTAPDTAINQGTDPVYGTRDWTGTDADGNDISGTEDYVMTPGTDPSISTEAQDVAKAQGVTYENLANVTETERTDAEGNVIGAFDDAAYSYDAAGTKDTLEGVEQDDGTRLGGTVNFAPGTDYVDQSKSTVAGQLNTLTDDSGGLTPMGEMIKNAETATQDQMQGRGMLNSTMAAQAGRKAGLDTAMTAAQQDAKTYAQAQGLQQQSEYGIQTMQGEAIVSSGLVTQEANILRRQTDVNNAFQSLFTGANAQNQAFIADLQNTYQEGILAIQNTQQELMKTMDISANQTRDFNQFAAASMDNYSIFVENAMLDPNFAELEDDSQQSFLKNMAQQVANGITTRAAFLGEEMQQTVSDDMQAWVDAQAYDDINAIGNTAAVAEATP